MKKYSILKTLRDFRDKTIKNPPNKEMAHLAAAIDAAMPTLEKMNHIKAIEYTLEYPTLAEQMVAVFDDRKATEKEVNEFIRIGMHYHPHIVVMYRDQFESIFRSGNTDEEKEDST